MCFFHKFNKRRGNKMKLRIFALCFAVALFMWVPARAAEPVPVEIVSVYQGSKNYYDNKCYSVSWYDSAGVYHSKWMSKAEYNNLRKACERNAARIKQQQKKKNGKKKN